MPGRARRGDDLPPLSLAGARIVEATPDPPPGPARDVLAEQAALRADRAALAMTTAMTGITDRLIRVALERLRGPRARRGTRYWTDSKPNSKAARPANLEVKALDDGYIVPDSMVEEVDEAMRPVALRVAMDAAEDTAARLGRPLTGASNDDGMFAVDGDLLAGLIDDALADMAGVAGRYVADVRAAIVAGDTEDLEFDALVERVEQAAQAGANRLRLDARTVGTALAASAALEQARALGVTTTQWISRRDDRVRLTHRLADGQVREIGEPFTVGRHELEYPGDPAGLPATAEEVFGCRCGLLFAAPDPRVRDALSTIADAESGMGEGADALFSAMADVLAGEDMVPVPGAREMGLPDLAEPVVTAEPVVGWRVLTLDAPDLRAGQRVELPEGTVLGLAAPADPTAATLSVLVPAGTRVGVSGGTVVLLDTVAATVLAVSAYGAQAALF